MIRVDGADAGAEGRDEVLDARGLVEAEHLEVVEAATEIVFVGGTLRRGVGDGRES